MKWLYITLLIGILILLALVFHNWTTGSTKAEQLWTQNNYQPVK